MARIEDDAEASELAQEIKAKVEELRDTMVQQIEESRPETDEEPPEIDRESLPIRLPDDILYKLLKIALQENACRNRGYILDGYPRTFKDACEVFLRRTKKFDEEGNEIEEEEPELEEGEEKSYEGYEPNPDIFPSNVLVMNGDDSFLIERVKNLSEKEI